MAISLPILSNALLYLACSALSWFRSTTMAAKPAPNLVACAASTIFAVGEASGMLE